MKYCLPTLLTLICLCACNNYKPNISLMEAIEYQRLQDVKAWLKQGVQVNEFDKKRKLLL